MSFIHQVKINDVNYDVIGSCYYGTSSTAAGTAAKVATVSNADSFVLVPGVTVAIKFTTSNSASSPTLNVNETGAKSIRYRGAAITSSTYYWAANQVVTFVYDGTYWHTTDYLKNPNSDTKVTTNLSDSETYSGNYPLILKNTTVVTDSPTTTVRYSSRILANPHTGTITAEALNVNELAANDISVEKIEANEIYTDTLGATDSIIISNDDGETNINSSTFTARSVDGTQIDILPEGIIFGDESSFGAYFTYNQSSKELAWADYDRKEIKHPHKAGTIALTSDIPTIPTSLKSPGTLTIQSKGTNVATYDGSGNITANIPWTDINVTQKKLPTTTDSEFPLLLRGDEAGTTDITKTTSFRANTTLNPKLGIITTSSGTSVGTYGPSDITLTDSSGTVSIGSHDDKILLSGYGLTLASGGTNELTLTADADGLKVTEQIYANGKKYAGGTAVTLNATSKAGSTASIYAPITSGTSGQILKSNGSGKDPTWIDGANLVAPKKITLVATAGQTSFNIPFEYDRLSSNLTVYFNGILMKETDNYTVNTSNNTVNLVDFSAEAGDVVTIMGLLGAQSIDFGQEAIDAINQINAAVAAAKEEIDIKVEEAITNINNLKASLPPNWEGFVTKTSTNIMGSGSKITMDSNYIPSGSHDVTTKTYVDSAISTATSNIVTDVFYMGNTEDNTKKKLLWIDTSSGNGNGIIKYHNGSAWIAVSSPYT